MRLFTFLVPLLVATVAGALEPLPVPEPREPTNKWNVARFGDPAEIKAAGYFVHTTSEGLAVSPIHPYEPRLIPGTEGAGYVDISDDGRWILYSDREATYLIRPDGSGKTVVPVTPRAAHARKKHRTLPVVFYHHSPLGDEIAFIASGREIKSIRVDLSGSTPTFGATRAVVDFTGIEGEPGKPFKLDFNDDSEQRFTVAANHVFLNVNGWAGSATHHMITIPDGGKGTATGRQHIFDRAKSPKWECGSAMSHCGRIVAQNPGAKIQDDFPNETAGGHKETVVYPFYEADQPTLEVARDLYTRNALAICWVPKDMRGEDTKADFHHWYFSNDPAYIIGTNQGQRGMKGKVEDFKNLGIYLLHWPTGTYYRISDDKTRAHYMACHFYRDETRSQIQLPPLAGTAGKNGTSSKDSAPGALPALVVEVTARELSSVPAKEDLGVYKHVTRFIRYEVDRVVEGKLDGRSIVIGHWSVRDREFTEAAKYREGQRLRITCQTLSDQDEVTMARTIDDIEDLDLPRYWASDVRPLGKSSQ